jgi:hypothetical protein
MTPIAAAEALSSDGNRKQMHNLLETCPRFRRLTAATTFSMNRQDSTPWDFSPYSRETIRVALAGGQETFRVGYRLIG